MKLWISVWLTEPHESGYRYLISKGATGYAAFRTKRGFQDFMARCRLEIDREETRVVKGGTVKRYKPGSSHFYDLYREDLIVVYMCCKPREIEEMPFWKLADLPETAEPFVGLSNGSYVTCYYANYTDKTIIYRPNPNAKGVYNPYDTTNHIAYSLWRS